jgi:hypothetical protein
MKAIVMMFLVLALNSKGQQATSAGLGQSVPDAMQPSVVVESVLANGRVQTLGGRPGPTLSVTIPPNPRHIEIHYGATNLTSPDQAHFRFRLDGIDRGWVDAGSSRFVSYVRLPAGRYQFVVNVAGPDGIWNGGGSILNITIESPWYGSWFWVPEAAIMLLVIIGAFYFLAFGLGRHNVSTEIHR